MKKIIWIGIVILLGLLLLSFVRERFEPTESIKGPPYGPAEKVRIFNMALQRSTRAPYNFLGYQDTLLNKARQQNPNESDDTKLKEAAGGLVSPTIEAFFTEVYRPAAVPITELQIDSFLATRTSDIKDIEKQLLKTYFIDQGGVGTGMRSGYAEELARMGQNYGYMRPNAPGSESGPTGPAGAGAAGAGAAGTGPTGPAGSGAGAGAAGTGPTGPAGAGSGAAAGATGATGTTAPGGSGVTPASVRKSTILGPVFTSYGSPLDGNGVDSSKSSQYPELLGGGDPAARRREQGGGSGGGYGMNIDLKGSMPTAEGLGTTEQSRFFPSSRQPGDMELIPDPYRVSQQFSSSSYSFKTEPTPFLTDFSAFLR